MTEKLAMTEAELLHAVQLLAADYHLQIFHCRDSRRESSGAGFPDLVIAGRRGVLFVELKSFSGSLTPDQRRWGSVLREAGQEWIVWRPSQLVDGTITRALESISVHRQTSLIQGVGDHN
jgi:hypothetical protein